ncbi:hypothetical protein AHF37_08247 [Paragonimus kellicotti]|nr:hypothetical protein AHF37_08247 [Paragonimus kellicotti]
MRISVMPYSSIRVQRTGKEIVLHLFVVVRAIFGKETGFRTCHTIILAQYSHFHSIWDKWSQ